jgi:phosphate transport system permease protein
MRDLWRRGLSLSVLIFCGSSVLLALVPLAFILFYVVTQGITALNLDFFRHTPAPVGETGGGMANAIVGSLIVTALGALFAIPVGVLSGFTPRNTVVPDSPLRRGLPPTPSTVCLRS